jgi:CubicO group peptidase (beta-lactamase class C family)
VQKLTISKYLLFIALIGSSCSSTNTPQKIDEFAERTLKEWEIPGLSLAVVHKGKEVRVAGYGVRERGTDKRVDIETLFQVGSLTKAFAGLTVAMLAEEGKVQLEQPIITYLPQFQLKDPVAREQMTLRDLLSHRTGLPGVAELEPMLWWHTDRSPEELMRRLAYVEPVFPFRAHFSYNNMAYLVAGQVVAATTGMSWQEFCKQRVLEPLGMKRTNTSYESLAHDPNVASPHLLPRIREKPIDWLNLETVAAAGGINSCASDMALWLKFCLSGSAALQLAQKPQCLFEPEGFLEKVKIPAFSIYAHGAQIASYGLGWIIYTLDNKTVFFHTGLSGGMQSILAVIPEEELGIAILTNEMGHLGAACLLNFLIDHILEREAIDWNQKGHAVVAESNQTAKQETELLENPQGRTPPTLKQEAYTGEYVHPAYGSILVGMKNDALTIKLLFNREEGKLEHLQKDRFRVTGIPVGLLLPWIIEFQLSPEQDKAAGLLLPNLGVFERVDGTKYTKEASKMED